MRKIIWFFALIFLWSACEKEIKDPLPNRQKQVTAILFEQSQKMEIWEADTLLLSKELAFKKDLFPIGFFKVKQQKDHLLEIDFPDAFRQRKAQADHYIFQEKQSKTIHLNEAIDWKSKQWTLEEIVIIPSGLDSTEALQAIYPSPHWLSELYGQIGLYLDSKQKNKPQ